MTFPCPAEVTNEFEAVEEVKMERGLSDEARLFCSRFRHGWVCSPWGPPDPQGQARPSRKTLSNKVVRSVRGGDHRLIIIIIIIYIYIYIHIHTYIHIYIYTHTLYIYIYTYTHTHIYMYIQYIVALHYLLP